MRGIPDVMPPQFTVLHLYKAPFSLHYIKGGNIPCDLPTAPKNTTTLDTSKTCSYNATLLSANGVGTLSWYNDANGGTFLGSGNTIVPDSNHTTYYVQDSTLCGASPRTAINVLIKNGPSVTLRDTAICAGSSVLFNAYNSNCTYQWSGKSLADTSVITASQSGTYKVVVSNIKGCKDSSSVSLFVRPLPQVTLIAAKDTFDYSELNIPLSGGLPAGGIYSIFGKAGNTLDALINGEGNFTLKYTYTDSNTCSNSAFDTITVTTTSLIKSLPFLKALIDLGIDTNNDNKIDSSEAKAVISLVLSSINLTNLEELDIFTNLQNLDISNNQLTSLDVSNLSNLVSLICNNNQLTSIIFGTNTSNKTTGLPNLTTLDCSNNQLTSLDLRDLDALTNMNSSGNGNLTMICVSNADAAQSNANFIKDNTSAYSEICTTGITNISNDAISIYPNPASQEITITGSFQSLSIVNTLGQTIINSSSSTVDVSSLQSGLYFIQINASYKNTSNIKLVIE